MIAPNFSLFLWIMLLVLAFDAICKIILGIMGVQKSDRYGIADILDGILWLTIVIVVLLF
jgi:hypothetical protein